MMSTTTVRRSDIADIADIAEIAAELSGAWRGHAHHHAVS